MTISLTEEKDNELESEDIFGDTKKDNYSDDTMQKVTGSDINLCILSGTLDAMPKIINTQNNTQGIALSLAVSRVIKDKLTQDLKDLTSWYNLVSYNDTVVNIGSKLKKGQKILAQGSLSVRSWMDQTGQKRIRYELNMEKLQAFPTNSHSDSSAAFDLSSDVEDGLPF